MNPVEAVLAPSRNIGRYFGIVSGVTSLIPVAFGAGLLATNAIEGQPSMAALALAVSSVGLQELTVIALLTLATAVVLHPLQFGLTQLLEGYWGPTRAGRIAMARSSSRHMDRWFALSDLASEANREVRLRRHFYRSAKARGDVAAQRVRMQSAMVASLDANEAQRALAYYPQFVEEVMPTRLGNVLRRYETETRDMFGLNPVVAMPYAGLVAPAAARTYLDDQRSAMDLSVRLTLIWAICTVMAALALWDDGVWNVVTLTTYCLIMLSYRGAVRSATFYGSAITSLVTLSRTALLEQFRLPAPANSEAERAEFEKLTAWLQGEAPALRYIKAGRAQNSSGPREQ